MDRSSSLRVSRTFSVAQGVSAPEEKRPVILATASVFPPYSHPQEAFCERFIATHKLTPEDEAFVRRVFKATMIENAQSYLPRDRLFEKMTRTQYVEYVRPSLLDLGLRAARSVLEQWGGNKDELTHIVWGTMTGTIHAPTLDILIVRELGLPNHVKRLSIENMGCLTGFRCLNVASEIAVANPKNKVLVIVCDIRSALQNQLRDHEANTPIDRSDVVVTSLFRDSGGAAIVAAPPSRSEAAAARAAISTSLAEGGRPQVGLSGVPLYEVIDGRSYVIPDSGHLVDYHEAENASIRLFIHKDLPDVVKANLPDLVKDLLAPAKISIQDCCFAIHTGGPKVIRNCAAALGVTPEVMGTSWHVMKEHGNLSGSSNLVVLDHLRRLADAAAEGVEEKEYCICVSMGPGVCVEAVLLRRFGWDEMKPKILKRQSTQLSMPADAEAAADLVGSMCLDGIEEEDAGGAAEEAQAAAPAAGAKAAAEAPIRDDDTRAMDQVAA